MTANMKNPARLVDVAKSAGVSRVVAAHVLMGTGGRNTRCAPETAEKVRKIAKMLNYRPNRAAQQLRGAKSGIIGILAHSSSNEFLTERLHLLEREADAKGYRVMIGRVSEKQEKIAEYLDDFSSRGVDGIVFLASPPEDDDLVRQSIKSFPAPVLCYSKHYENATTFNIDRASGVSDAYERLVEAGYRHIGIQLSTATTVDMQTRLSGYEQARTRFGATLKKKLVYAAEDFRDFDIEDSRWEERAARAVESLVFDGVADAIIATDDIWAAYIVKHLKKIGKSVPEDVGVVGFDNSDVAKIVSPSITSVDQNHHELARALIDFITNRDQKAMKEDERILIKPKLVERESTRRSKNV